MYRCLCVVQVLPVKELRERHLGVLEGLTRSQAAVQYPTDFANLSGFPNAKPQATKDSAALHCLTTSCLSFISGNGTPCPGCTHNLLYCSYFPSSLCWATFGNSQSQVNSVALVMQADKACYI